MSVCSVFGSSVKPSCINTGSGAGNLQSFLFPIVFDKKFIMEVAVAVGRVAIVRMGSSGSKWKLVSLSASTWKQCQVDRSRGVAIRVVVDVSLPPKTKKNVGLTVSSMRCPVVVIVSFVVGRRHTFWVLTAGGEKHVSRRRHRVDAARCTTNAEKQLLVSAAIARTVVCPSLGQHAHDHQLLFFLHQQAEKQRAVPQRAAMGQRRVVGTAAGQLQVCCGGVEGGQTFMYMRSIARRRVPLRSVPTITTSDHFALFSTAGTGADGNGS
mmetsp:Transcript_28200/g.71555  ORF Transcript_28200/g.71555 Transcript_28200/m.71555 type:complete len:267 (+) Transcript_28200:1399-2199(+)